MTRDVDKLAALVLTDNSNVLSRLQALEKRQHDIIGRIARLEALSAVATATTQRTATAAPPAAVPCVDAGASPVHRRLQQELMAEGISAHRFVRAPPEYYDRDLEFRRAVLQAASVDHLCKSVIMENTRVEAVEPGVTKYWLVVVQYSARLHSDKLRNFVHAAHGGNLPKSRINMRLCPEAVSDELTGFEHNAVSPVGIRTRLPIILSHRIPPLRPDFFWLGAGEVDLKVGLSAEDFVRVYQPHVVDCTYADVAS